MKTLFRESTALFNSLVGDIKVQEYLFGLETHHKRNYNHSLRVGRLSIDLGFENGYRKRDLNVLGYGGILHDMGKEDIPLEILEKQGPLSDEEKMIMQGHSRLGFIKIKEPEFEDVRKIVVGHHEYKRNPYPRHGEDRREEPRNGERRRNDGIDELVQIVAACDMFDALGESRSYKEPMDPREVERIMRSQYTGSPQFIRQLMRRAA